jgi:hypothetical protein
MLKGPPIVKPYWSSALFGVGELWALSENVAALKRARFMYSWPEPWNPLEPLFRGMLIAPPPVCPYCAS